MQFIKLLTIIAGLLFYSAHSWGATTYYVNASNTFPVSPFNTWSTAATNIQDAINSSTNGDTILVTNGVYQFGGMVMTGNLTNRVAINKSVMVQSVNGPKVTVIQGSGATNSANAVRCAWLTNGASLIGFTLQGGATLTSGNTATLLSGGGVWCASSNAIVSNCLIVSNTAYIYGGGLYQGTVNSSLITSNWTGLSTGGAAYQAVLVNCTLVSNANYGVASPIAMTNCIIYYNGVNYSASGTAYSHCCTTPALTGTGNFTNAPQLFADGIHLVNGSPCIGAGIKVLTGTDMFGTTWLNPPSVGCAEWQPAPLVNVPQIKLTSSPVGFTVGNAAYSSQPPFALFWLQNGSPLQDNGHFNFTQTANLAATGVSLSDAGSYQLVVSNSFGMVTSAVVTLVIHCVDSASSNSSLPYSTWSTAATNIQMAITTASVGDVILVANGIYATGGISMDGVITNRVAINKAMLVQSVNGPNATIIQGAWDSTSTNGLGAVRCVWMTNNAILNGFTLKGGATRSVSASLNNAMYGGGVFGTSKSAVICNSLLTNNFASYAGGGVYSVTLNYCTLAGNQAVGSGKPGVGVADAGKGGGAESCILTCCIVTANLADQSGGGGVDNCILNNCSLTMNSSYMNGGGANGGSLVNCTVTGNTASGYSSGYGAAVFGANLTNCIVSGNFSRTPYPNTNYASCTLAYSCSDPLATGPGNVSINPQLLADGVHLTATSSCIGAGTVSVVSATDIDGQQWNNPPSMGCDEWQPSPVIGAQPSFQVNLPAHGLTFNLVVAGQTPFSYFWSHNGVPIQDDGHCTNSAAANLVVNNFGPNDSGLYQVVVSNVAGVVTSQIAQVVIHVVSAAGSNPVAPYATWATAAADIQDAINVASAGDIVLVTNGVYAAGGMVVNGILTNRVALTLPLTLTSVNGYKTTLIQGAWDPVTTNGPGAVRCAYVSDGAVLNGFTLQNGATLSTGDAYSGGPLESGGGVWCNSTSGIVADCVLTNNSAIYGGGIAYGTLNNSLELCNLATYGGGAYGATLNNCTVANNIALTVNGVGGSKGAGTYGGIARNSMIINNYANYPFSYPNVDNFYNGLGLVQYSYCCTSPTSGLAGPGNIASTQQNFDLQLLDWFHIAVTSPCRGAGSALYASGTDLDGESWANPPSIGCDEAINSNLVGPLSVSVTSYQSNVLANHFGGFSGSYNGRASSSSWLFGDGQMTTNSSASNHSWTNPGLYTITYTVFNNDNPSGVSATTVIQVLPLIAPQLRSPVLLTNGFQFQFAGQTNANYTVQYATNLSPPIAWKTLQTIYYNNASVLQITDSAQTNGSRFYRVNVQ